jgi:hypothetical protein
MNKKFEVGVTRTLKAVEREAIAADRKEVARPAVTIIHRSATPGPRPGPAPRAPAAPARSTATDAPAGSRWTMGRTEIAALIAAIVIIILILTSL